MFTKNGNRSRDCALPMNPLYYDTLPLALNPLARKHVIIGEKAPKGQGW